MTVVVVTALGVGIGVLGLVAALRPARPSLRGAMIQLERQVPLARRRSEPPGTSSARVDRYLAGRLVTAVSERDSVSAWLSPLLAMGGVSVQEFCGQVLLGTTVGVLLPGLWWMVVTVGGVHVPFVVPIWAALVLGFGGGALPVVRLHSRGSRARQAARRVVGSYLNLVVLCLAGGMGIEGALHASARIGEDDVSARILNALIVAQDAGETPWDALDRLGRDLGVTELTELAAAVALAGGEGARIRLTLAAKASSIRRHGLAQAEAEANTVTERLFLPGVFLLVGFLLFIGYPAVARISAGL
jgi:tight adherence protein C